MKTQLTAEQSAELIRKGVNPRKAGHCNRDGFFFNIGDLLSHLPKEIEIDGNRFRLRMEICPLNSEWTAAYVDLDNDPLHGAMDEELIVCLYHVALWCADNNCLNKE